MAFTTDSKEFGAAFQALVPKLRACPSCGINAARLLNALERDGEGRIIQTICSNCGFTSNFNVEGLLLQGMLPRPENPDA